MSSSDFLSRIYKGVVFQFPHVDKPVIYDTREGRSVEVSETTPGAMWQLPFEVDSATDKTILADASQHFSECKSRNSRMGNFETVHGRKEVDGGVRYNTKRKTMTSMGKQNQEPRIVDGKRMPLENRAFWGGSTGNIKVTMMPSLNQSSGEWGISLLLDSAQVLEAIYGDAAEDFEIVEGAGGNAYDFDDEIPFGT